MLSLYLTVANFYEAVVNFFKYTLWGKKSPYTEMKERDPYIYEDD